MSTKQQSILLGGVVAALLSTSYIGFINCLCCLGVIIGAVTAVWHYTETNQLTIRPGEGAVMGLVVGALGAFIAIFLNYALIKAGVRHDAAIVDLMLQNFGDALDPAQYDQLAAQRDEEVSFVPHFVNGLLSVAVSAVFGAIGGAIGASLFKKGDEGAPAV